LEVEVAVEEIQMSLFPQYLRKLQQGTLPWFYPFPSMTYLTITSKIFLSSLEREI
jgi:hypothetical protein